jgi:AP2-associated kinase
MHACSPPIAHRDIKPENVLCVAGTYKLCDFGSASTKHITPGVEVPVSDVEDDIARNTTLQYRAPEQVDAWSNKHISEKVDIWALGVLLYKLMFFEDAFGEATLVFFAPYSL